jgi:hypothetical protein
VEESYIGKTVSFPIILNDRITTVEDEVVSERDIDIMTLCYLKTYNFPINKNIAKVVDKK